MEIDKEYTFSKQELHIIEAALKNYMPRLAQVTKIPQPYDVYPDFVSGAEKLLSKVDILHKRVKEAVDNHG